MVLGKLPVPGRPTILITVGQGPTALVVGAGGGCLDIFTLIYGAGLISSSGASYNLDYNRARAFLLIYPCSHLSPSLWEGVVGWCDGAG